MKKKIYIDFNVANKLSKTSGSGTLPYLPRSAHLGEKRCAKDDWESFLYSMCHAVDHDLGWFRIANLFTIRRLKQNTTNTLVSTYSNYKLLFTYYIHLSF